MGWFILLKIWIRVAPFPSLHDKLNQTVKQKTSTLNQTKTHHTTENWLKEEKKVCFLISGIVIHPQIEYPLLTHFRVVKLSNITLTAGEYYKGYRSTSFWSMSAEEMINWCMARIIFNSWLFWYAFPSKSEKKEGVFILKFWYTLINNLWGTFSEYQF